MTILLITLLSYLFQFYEAHIVIPIDDTFNELGSE